MAKVCGYGMSRHSHVGTHAPMPSSHGVLPWTAPEIVRAPETMSAKVRGPAVSRLVWVGDQAMSTLGGWDGWRPWITAPAHRPGHVSLLAPSASHFAASAPGIVGLLVAGLLRSPFHSPTPLLSALQVDIYSFGIVMWEALTMAAPFKDDLSAYLLRLVNTRDVIRPPVPGLDGELGSVVEPGAHPRALGTLLEGRGFFHHSHSRTGHAKELGFAAVQGTCSQIQGYPTPLSSAPVQRPLTLAAPPLHPITGPGWIALMQECWAEDPAARPDFPTVVDRLRRIAGRARAEEAAAKQAGPLSPRAERD